MTRYLDLGDYIAIAADTLDLEPAKLRHVLSVHLADSALHAPQARFEDVEFYADLFTKAGVLLVHLARTHALVDGNKRTAWTCTREFLARNGATETRPFDAWDVVDLLERVASNQATEEEVITFISFHWELP